MNARRTRQDRLQALLDELMAHPHEPRSLVDVAHSVGREVTASFGADLAAVRDLAADNGDQVTRCEYTRGGPQVFRFLPKGDEHGLGRPGLNRQSNDVKSRARNLGRSATYMVAHAVHPGDRASASIDLRVATVVADIMAMRDEVTVALGTAHHAEVRRVTP